MQQHSGAAGGRRRASAAALMGSLGPHFADGVGPSVSGPVASTDDGAAAALAIPANPSCVLSVLVEGPTSLRIAFSLTRSSGC